jgi:hypothetical protein
MPRDFAAVNVSIWQDEDWRALPPQAQHLYLTLWTHPKLSYCGVVDWRPGRLAALSAGWTTEDVVQAGDCLRARHFIVTDDETEECLIRSWVRWDGLMKQPRMAVSYANAYAAVASTLLRRVLVHELIRLRERQPDLAGFSKPQVQAMFDLPEVSAKDAVAVSDPFGDGFTHRFTHKVGGGLGPPQGEPQAIGLGSVSVPPTPSPTPAPLSSTPPPTEGTAKAKPTKKRAHALPEGWMPSEANREKVKRERPDLNLRVAHEDFRLYWKANGGTKVDWDACWLRWMRNQKSGDGTGRQTTTPTHRSPTDDETCTKPGHSGWARNCAQCRADALAGTPDVTPPPKDAPRRDITQLGLLGRQIPA